MSQGELFARASAANGTVAINARCVVRTDQRHRVVLVAGMPIAQYAVGDRMAEAHAMVLLVDQGWAEQGDVARSFGAASRTVRRHQRRFEAGGLVALGRPAGCPLGTSRVAGERVRIVSRLKADGCSNREIARRVGVSETAIRKLLRRLGWCEQKAEQLPLPATPSPSETAVPGGMAAVSGSPAANPNLSAPARDEILVSADTDPADRHVDRLLAHLGMLDDAAPLFRDGSRVPHAGVLLAIPALVTSGFLDDAHAVYGPIGPAFYGLRTTLVALVVMALLRIKRPENLKEHSPEDLGRVLGLDRAPEVKTLRRKLTRLAALSRATDLGRRLAERRVTARGDAMGFLYVDGHVRVYHGEREIPKTHVARIRLAMPATTDYWINDAIGEPLFVVTSEANAGMVKILPAILATVRGLVGERRVTVVFDRGGWSPKLFLAIIAAGFDVLTYRKGAWRRVPRSRFVKCTATLDGEKVDYTLADQGIVLLDGKLRMRQVTRLSDDGAHQTPIVTSRRDLSAIEVAFRMFRRWKQENFSKYLREEYALDALADYAVEPDDPTREVPNPKWAAVDAKWQAARRRIAEANRRIGVEVSADAICGTSEATLDRATRLELADALKNVMRLAERRERVPRRIPVGKRSHGEVIKLATERKHLTNVLKMVAYQAESDLVRAVAKHYHRADDEGRTLVQTALAAPADIRVDGNTLHVTLAPLSSPHRTQVIAAVCAELNTANVCFPGTRLRLRYAVGPKTAPDRTS